MTDFNIYDAGDVFDSRDLIERLDELEDRAEEGALIDDERAELDALHKVAAEGESFSDWYHGVTFVADDHFTIYARELAEEVGDIPAAGTQWPLSFIDWDAAADALQSDYTDITVNGFTYWGRA